MAKHGDLPFWIPAKDGPVEIDYEVKISSSGSGPAETADVSLARIYKQTRSKDEAFDTNLVKTEELKKTGTGTLSIDITKFTAANDSPLLVVFVFEKTFKGGPKDGEVERTELSAGIVLGDPAPATIEVPKVTLPGKTAKCKVLTWGALVYDAPNEPTEFMEEELAASRVDEAIKTGVKWRTRVQPDGAWDEADATGAEDVELTVPATAEGKTLDVQAFAAEEAPPGDPTMGVGQTLCPKLLLVRHGDEEELGAGAWMAITVSMKVKGKLVPEPPEDVTGTWAWTSADPAKLKVETAAAQETAIIAGEEKGKVELTVEWTPPDSSEKLSKKAKIDVKEPKVTWVEDGTNYGYDIKTDKDVPWKSVEKAKTDTVVARIEPAFASRYIKFTSTDEAVAKVSPADGKAHSEGKVKLTVTGVADGTATVQAKIGEKVLGKFKVQVYTKKSKTVGVRLVHEKNYTSTDAADGTLTAFADKVYKQAVFEWKLTRLAAKTVEFDKNGDGKVDVDNWMSDEMKAIRDGAKDDSYDRNVFIVSKPSDGSFGFADFNQKYVYMHPELTITPEMTYAHELGHTLGLKHPPDEGKNDPSNVMTQGEGTHMYRLRKYQWDKVNV